MLFHSYGFIFLFLPLTLLGFFLLGRYGLLRWALAWLVLASLTFYGWWNVEYLFLLLASIVVNYLLGRALAPSQRTTASARVLLAIGIGLNLALLAYFKYAAFIVGNFNQLLGSDYRVHEIVLPLAISFFTFQQIAYLVDAYYGRAQEYSFLNYSLFVSFFPQLIAGPIVHHREMMPQFEGRRIFRFSYEDMDVGLLIFCIGLFKKVLLADGMAQFSEPVFAAAAGGLELSFFEAWGGALAYTLQIYFDFSAYSDMAIGLAWMFGIRLPLNFASPYKAINIIEFWRRWHMTLSRFLRDYLYIPLGGNRKGRERRHLNIMATMLLGGLWHGAAWTFVVWGG
ncbi:MAG: MBOAT family O-acyltransferase, partial [Gammaproteobacteria bacterium]